MKSFVAHVLCVFSIVSVTAVGSEGEERKQVKSTVLRGGQCVV